VYRDWNPGPDDFTSLLERVATEDGRGKYFYPEVRLALELLDLSPMLMGKLLRSWLVEGGVWQSDAASSRALLGVLESRIHERILIGQRAAGGDSGLDEASEHCAKLLGGVDVWFLNSLLNEATQHIHQGCPLDEVTADNLDVAISKVPLFRDLLALEILRRFDRPSARKRRGLAGVR